MFFQVGGGDADNVKAAKEAGGKAPSPFEGEVVKTGDVEDQSNGIGMSNGLDGMPDPRYVVHMCGRED